MCTVTYIPKKQEGGFVLTSNRDEKVFRPTIAPRVYESGATKIGFPKDEKAGGSWIAANNKGRLCCLLNGAFVAHKKKPTYALSRGNILIEVASTKKSPYRYFAEKDFLEVEPFTIISVENSESGISHFSEFIWDSVQKHFRLLNADEPQIWSSVTLYSKQNRDLRGQWFRRFLEQQNGDLSPESILSFHAGKHTNDRSVNLVMEREDGLKTVSITQVIPENGKFRMHYIDLHNQQNASLEI